VLHGSLGVLNYHDNGLKYAQHLVDKLQSNGLSKTPEGVAIWITARTLYPDIQVPTHTWHNDDPLNPKEKATLAKILMETTTNQADKNGPDQTIQRGMWSSRLHFAWAVVFESILTPQPKRVKFAALWAEVIEGKLPLANPFHVTF
jgi:DNA polymerase phi